MTGWGIAVTAALAVWTAILWDWDKRLRHWDRRPRRSSPSPPTPTPSAPSVPDCDVCITGASVSSFLTTADMCRAHRAHWRLVHDLEAQVFGASEGVGG